MNLKRIGLDTSKAVFTLARVPVVVLGTKGWRDCIAGPETAMSAATR